MYLIRNGKVEFSGTRKQIIDYVKLTYEDDYWIQEWNDQLQYDFAKLKFVLENLGLYIGNRRK